MKSAKEMIDELSSIMYRLHKDFLFGSTILGNRKKHDMFLEAMEICLKLSELEGVGIG